MSNGKPGCLGFILQALGLLPKVSETVTNLPYAVRDDFLSNGKAIIFAKVVLKDVLFVKTADKRKRTFFTNKIHLKHVDFLVCSVNDLKPLYAVELDDSSHMRKDQLIRDAIKDQAFEAAGLKLIFRQAKKGANIGQAFYGCFNYPRCREVIYLEK